MTVQDHSDYRTLNERLTDWRREILTRMVRTGELASLPAFPRQNLAAAPGTEVRVDSFLGTVNTDGPDDAYPEVLDAPGGVVAARGVPFAVEDMQHPTLAELRRRFDLATVAGDGDDVSRAVRVRDWIKSLFPHLTPYRMPEWNALLILDRGSRGVERFICVHYSVAFVQSCLALGLQARMINLHRGIAESYAIGDEAVADPPVDEHVVAEVWSSQLAKWVMMDTDFDCHYDRGGEPLSAWDIHVAHARGELDSLHCARGKHSASFDALGDALPDPVGFFSRTLPSYYAHVSVLMRNDFLSDPDGPVTIAHPVDELATPILWHRGSDNRLQPHLMGPVVVAGPATDRTPILTDGNSRTGWASDENASDHWVEIRFPAATSIGRVVLHWPEQGLYYRTSPCYRLEAELDGAWRPIAASVPRFEGPFSIHDLDPLTVSAVRVVQPAGGGFFLHPNRLWLTQIEIYPPA